MNSRALTIDELFSFAARNGGRKFETLKQRRPFRLILDKDRMRFELPSGTHFSVNREYAGWWLKKYNEVDPSEKSLTSHYPSKWRDRSYMVRILEAVREELSRSDRPSGVPHLNGVDMRDQGGDRRRWTRDELMVALNLYHKLTFGQMHARQPAIVAVAGKLGRGANSLAMKLCNFASLDPALRLRGIKGLSGASALDRIVWIEFHENLGEAAPASEEAFQRLFDPSLETEVEVAAAEGVRKRSVPQGATERLANVKVRRGQAYFRDSVLNNFGGRCGVTGLAIRELLVASHILPWNAYEAERLNVRNGIALSRLHDAAFDVGLVTFDADLRLCLSRSLRVHLSHQVVEDNFAAYEGAQLRMGKDSVLPDEKFLAVHRREVFRG